MLFKLGLRNIKQNLFMNVLIVLQMTVVFTIAIFMVSTIVSRFQLYMPLKDKLNSKGYFYYVENAINPETGNTLRTTDELYQLLEDTKDISATYNPWLSYEDKEITSISYDDGIINMYTPELTDGNWFDLEKDQSKTVQVVVSKNPYGFKVGDRITVNCFDGEIQAEIIGIIKDNAKIIGFSISKNGKYDCRNAYMNYCYDIEQKPLFIFSQKGLKDKMVTTQLNGPVFVTYNDSVANEVIESNNGIMKTMTTLSITKFSEMKSNSLDYIFNQIYTLFPILICVLILTLVGAVSVNALSAKKQLKNYAIYYICGLKWTQCSMINLISAFICVTISFIISIATIFVIKFIGILQNTVVSIGILQIICCSILITIYIILSVILPINIIGKNTPNQVLKSN